MLNVEMSKKFLVSPLKNIEKMFISGEECLLLALSMVERKDLVHDDQHGRGRTTGRVGVRYQGQISGRPLSVQAVARQEIYLCGPHHTLLTRTPECFQSWNWTVHGVQFNLEWNFTIDRSNVKLKSI